MNNTIKRTLSGAVFVLAITASLLLDKFLFAGLFIFVMVVMMTEFYKMTLGDKYIFPRVLAIIAGITMFALMFAVRAYGLSPRYLSAALLPVMLVMINSLYVKDKAEFWKFSHIYTGILYIAVPMSLANTICLRGGEFDGLLMLCFFIMIWSSDVGAFIFGCTLGRKFGRKLCPSISPNKSWVGFWGGMASSIVAAVLLKSVGFIDFPLLHCIALAVIMDVAGVYGDLFESQWKRSYDLKDSGNIIPGHGGMLDRFDSSLMAMPAGVLYMLTFNLL